MDKNYIEIPTLRELPARVYFRYDEFGADTHAAAHRHRWGQLNFTARGVMQLEIDGRPFMSPPNYAVWIPPNALHSCYNRESVVYRSVYIGLDDCRALPESPCAVSMNNVLRAILNDFAERDVTTPVSQADLNLTQVLLDQLHLAPRESDYLPYGSGTAVNLVLDQLRTNPGDTRSLAAWAKQVFVSERTLARHFNQELGMSFGEWRQRLRFLAAIEALEQGQSIKALAFDLGYSSSSAFITMFQRHAGCTPEQYRRQQYV
ncbi:AraC family transcriptional regulator [Marinobacter sp. X15-166B]|uniref:AraC family transcriptional regulator n=1 Tax=Marinobacter sp. X15-166B TaxID=1897620 RepID=UPI00085BC756|nr:helix-turn-helix transcriptional regulator [Marinobacter sp. X15-166B]OEY65914.1 AraC family transcriptional regulator [Marinobacter sp. X15-166B]